MASGATPIWSSSRTGSGSALAGLITRTASAYAGYAGVVALSDPVEGPPLDGLAAEYWRGPERFGVFDLGQDRRYWFHMATAPADAPPLGLDELTARAREWPEAVRAAIAATPAERLIAWPIHARLAPRRLTAGRVVCVGDAAHAMQPNLGQGACQVIEDAVALLSAARAGPADVPTLFEQLRLRRARTLVRRSAEGGWAAHGPWAMRAAMRIGMRLAPSAIQARMIAGLHQLPVY